MGRDRFQVTGIRNVVVVGAGIVGMAIAVQLRRDGHRVTVIDRLAPGEGCSSGNAGILAASSCVPLSMPGTLMRVPGWLLDPLGPLAIRWRYLPRLAPWLLRFVREGARARAERASVALRALLATTLQAHQALMRAAGAPDLVRPSGLLCVYETGAGFARDAAAWRLRRARGVRMEELQGGAVAEHEPALAPHCRRAVWLPDDGQVTDPLGVVRALAEHFRRAGGTILRREARGFDFGPEGPTGLATDQGPIPADVLVIAAGAWSGGLAARLGSPVPLESERGYHVMIGEPGVAPRAPVAAGERMFAVTPMAAGLRLAGTAEFGGLALGPNYARARALLRHGHRLFPGLQAEAVSEWMGHRPALPDSLPVIGRAPRHRNAYFAFGHGHIGLTAAPITGQAIADLVAGRPPPLDLAPFAADRF